MDVYGYDVDKMTDCWDASGAVGDNKTTINNALQTLSDKTGGGLLIVLIGRLQSAIMEVLGYSI